MNIWSTKLLVLRISIICLVICLFAGYIDPASGRETASTPICKIQGRYWDSPLEGEWVRTSGVVYADLDDTVKRGFFIQAENCDEETATSDGIFVYLGERLNVVNVGDLVEVTGTVQEYYGMTELSVPPGNVVPLSSGNPLPNPVELVPPFANDEAAKYWESLEGMYVFLDEAAVVGPTNDADETWVVPSSLGVERVFHDDPRGTGEIFCLDDGGLFEVSPEARVGDRVRSLLGALEYSVGVYRLELLSLPVLVPGLQTSSSLDETAFEFTFATFNLSNLFDTYDDPATEDTVLSAGEYQRRLQKRALAIYHDLGEPVVIAVQEAENQTVLQALVARPEIQADYSVVWVDGPDERGIDVALLYRTDRAALIGYQVRQGCTSRLDGLGPDGNRDTANPQNNLTCDTDGNGTLDGNRLFSRPPLVVHLQVCPSACQNSADSPLELWVVVNHWKSKTEDTILTPYTLPRRIEQAQFVARLVQEIRQTAPGANLIVLGDLNDHPESQPLVELENVGLQNLMVGVDQVSRYNYIHQGISQVLDYVLVELSPQLGAADLHSVHINADFPSVFNGVAETSYRSSDHDPVLVRFVHFDRFIYLPMVPQAQASQ